MMISKGLGLARSNVIALLALFVALGGTSYAATGGFTSSGKLQACVNEEGGIKLLKAGKHCKRGQKAVAWNQTGPAGAKGAAGAAGSAGATGATGPGGAANPNAAAVNGQSVIPIFATAVPGAPPVQVYSQQGFTLLFSCPNGGNTRLVANGPTGGAATLLWQGNSGITEKTFQGRVDHLEPGAEVLIGGGQYATGAAQYGTATGRVVSVTYAVDDAETGISQTDCSVWGHAISG
jgi:hypothetical protein